MNIGLGKKEDRWKVIVAGVLILGALVSLWINVFSSDSPPPPDTKAVAPQAVLPQSTSLTGSSVPPPPLTRRGMTGRSSGEFRPKLLKSNTAGIDPTLRLDLLAKVQNVPLEGGARNIFQIAVPPPVVAGPIPKTPPINVKNPVVAAQPVVPTGPPPPPPPPPIPFKYYGFSSMKGEQRKRAFFLDGEDIIVAWEGDLIKNRYRVIHVGVNSVDVEDTQFKNKQSLPLAEEAPPA